MTRKLKDFFDKNKIHFLVILNLLMAVFLLSGLFYLRFLPRVSRDLWENMSTNQVFYQLLIISFIVSAIVHTIRLIWKIEVKEQSPLLEAYTYPLKVVYNYMCDVLITFYEFLWFVLEKISKKFFNKPCLHFWTLLPLVRSFTNPKHSKYYFWVLFSLKTLPRVIFVTALLYDVFFCKHFDYTFRCIPLLLIPLLESIFLFILKDYDKAHVFNLASFFKMEWLPDSYIVKYTVHTEDQVMPYGAKDFDDFIDNFFEPVNDILGTIKKYETWKVEKMKYYHIQLALQVLRLSAYCYVLYHGII